MVLLCKIHPIIRVCAIIVRVVSSGSVINQFPSWGKTKITLDSKETMHCNYRHIRSTLTQTCDISFLLFVYSSVICSLTHTLQVQIINNIKLIHAISISYTRSFIGISGYPCYFLRRLFLNRPPFKFSSRHRTPDLSVPAPPLVLILSKRANARTLVSSNSALTEAGIAWSGTINWSM